MTIAFDLHPVIARENAPVAIVPSSVSIGDAVLALGNPRGLEIVSSVREPD